jgi:hypothetical protein
MDKMRETGVAVGDDVFVLGFPLGRAGKEKKYAVVRGGLIVRMDEEIVADASAYLIDSSIFPGNSGGPVVLKPTVSAITGTEAVSEALVVMRLSSPCLAQPCSVALAAAPPRVEGLSRPCLIWHVQARLGLVKATWVSRGNLFRPDHRGLGGRGQSSAASRWAAASSRRASRRYPSASP